jgi:hypothetical protein
VTLVTKPWGKRKKPVPKRLTVRRNLLDILSFNLPIFTEEKALIKTVIANINPVRVERVFGSVTIVSINKAKKGLMIITEN